jgi:hypothetical protein
MGADLYLRSEFDAHFGRWEDRFKGAVAERDLHAKGTAAYAEAQREVVRCFGRMYERGHFRDPYNPGSVLLRMGLSWWRDVIPLLDEDGRLRPEKARSLIGLIEGRGGAFSEALALLPASERRYLEGRRQKLLEFLARAVELNEAIDCSL